MLRHFAFGIGLLATTILSSPVLAENARTLQIIVSKDDQSMTVYDGATVVATSRVSTGKTGHTTPSGIFSILEKRKYHESNIYSNAPMPFMQRLTWSGIALHESNSVPSYPASHGCVRMPGAFAKSLFGMTEQGVHVIISDAAVTPARIDHPTLFSPHAISPLGPLLSDAELRPSTMGTPSKPVEVAMNATASLTASLNHAMTTVNKEEAPLRILIHRRGERETLLDAQRLLTELGFDAGTPDGVAGSLTRSAIAGFKRWKGLPQNGLLSSDFLTALYETAGEEEPPRGQIMVRQSFKPLFEAPVGIRQPEIALGTHFFTADRIERNTGSAEWHAVTLANRMDDKAMKRLGISVEADPLDTHAAARALDRIEIPDTVRAQIELLMSEGTSLTITDQGLGPETGAGTDFITLTQSQPRMAEARPVQSKPKPARKVRSEPRVRAIGLY